MSEDGTITWNNPRLAGLGGKAIRTRFTATNEAGISRDFMIQIRKISTSPNQCIKTVDVLVSPSSAQALYCYSRNLETANKFDIAEHTENGQCHTEPNGATYSPTLEGQAPGSANIKYGNLGWEAHTKAVDYN